MDHVDSCGGNICQYCGKRLGKVWSRCAGCNDKNYCNDGCGEADWSTHRGLCRAHLPAAGAQVIVDVLDNDAVLDFIMALCHHWDTFEGAAHTQCYITRTAAHRETDIDLFIEVRRGVGNARDSLTDSNLSLTLVNPGSIEHMHNICSVQREACKERYDERDARIFDLITLRTSVYMHIYGDSVDIIIGRARFPLQ